MLKGIAASSGAAIGKVFKYVHPQVVVEKKAAAADELEKLKNAVAKTQQDIRTIQKMAEGKLSADDLAIFDAHLMVTEDPEFIGQIEEMVKNDNVNSDYAVDQVGNMFASMFESMEDAYFRERAADIKDVSYRLKCHIQGVMIPDLSLISDKVILVAEDLTPSDTAQLNKETILGFATATGGRTSHSAIMARSLEIPAVVGVSGLLEAVNHDDEIVLDAIDGVVIVKPDEAVKKEYKTKIENFAKLRESLKVLKDAPSVTLDEHHVELVGNIGTPKDTAAVIANGGEGIGLYRTEFLYMDAKEMPSEEDQFEAYKAVLQDMNPHPVVVRTLDIGGDKKLPYLPLEEEMNPFLGFRAIRICLKRPEIFRTQLRALIRASAFGNLCIMFPMIATLQEFRQAKAIYLEELNKIKAEGIAHSDKIQVGIMVEIPASAVLADQFAKEVDFFSIGTNDLIQYSMAADRMSEPVSYLYQPLNPSILRLVKLAIDGAHKEGKWCGMCGEMAGDPTAVPVLLGLGLDEFSMSATSILSARKIVRSNKYADLQELAKKALDCATAEEVAALVSKSVK
ncbi:MAG: phosphoenolpyruvate--protein phosphotransferase [Erysipelotrichaceae bacterium]|jgi:phosphotransferase system enzyme I (PtsI)|nr:phosphoenolpyruvate--protein phosphotransferase [Erysipelotrichaceae bacterium]